MHSAPSMHIPEDLSLETLLRSLDDALCCARCSSSSARTARLPVLARRVDVVGGQTIQALAPAMPFEKEKEERLEDLMSLSDFEQVLFDWDRERERDEKPVENSTSMTKVASSSPKPKRCIAKQFNKRKVCGSRTASSFCKKPLGHLGLCMW